MIVAVGPCIKWIPVQKSAMTKSADSLVLCKYSVIKPEIFHLFCTLGKT